MKRVRIDKLYGYPTGLPADFVGRLDRNFERLNENFKVVTKVLSTSYTIKETDELIVYTGTGGNTYYLPSATAYDGYQFTIKNAGSGNLTLDATGNGGIFSTLLANTLVLAVGDGVDVIAANGAWQVI